MRYANHSEDTAVLWEYCQIAPPERPEYPVCHSLQVNSIAGLLRTVKFQVAGRNPPLFRRFETLIGLAYQRNMSRSYKRSANYSIGQGEDMKKLLITGFALCFMGAAIPSFASPRQDQTQQDQMKKDDAMKKDDMSKDSMAKDSKSKKKMKKDNMKKDDAMKKDDGMRHDDMSKDAPKN
jgi:pentapeptide MXKDX repeat protein